MEISCFSYREGTELAERVAYYGVRGNLINFLTGKLGQSTAMAAANVNAWAGVSSMLPILGAVIADSFLGNYFTVIASSILYILGVGLLSLSAVLPSPSCLTHERSMLGCSPHSQTVLFFSALYLVAIGQGGHKPCSEAFAADQFDGEDPAESTAKSSFFNWLFFGLALGALLGIGVFSYVQDNYSWGLGFGIPCIIMVIALLTFVLGTSTYRYIKKSEGQSPFLRIGRVFLRAARNRCSVQVLPDDKQENQTIPSHHESQQFRFLDKALLASDASKVAGAMSSKSDVEEAKALLRLFPIWATSLVFGIVYAQTSTFFTKQGVTLDRSLGSSFKIPAASLQSFISICIITFIPIYDCLLVPVARSFTGKPAGISMLQRIGTGLFLSIVCMIIAALTESKRLQIALQNGLIDLPDSTVPMTIWWLIPQYALNGIAHVFTTVGLQEFFYNQVPIELRTVGISLYLSVLGFGSLLSSILVSLIDNVTSSGGLTGSGWLSDNLNRAHLDYFYWFLAGLNSLGLFLFMYFSKSYVYTNNHAHL